MMYQVPITCKDYPDYLRAVEVATQLNNVNPKFPLVCRIGSGPIDPEEPGERWVDIMCDSSAKIQHFLSIGSKIDRDINSLNKMLQLSDPVMAPDPAISSYDIIALGGNNDMISALEELERIMREQRGLGE